MANRYVDILKAPHQVSFDITNYCNLRCLHCFNSSGENDIIKCEMSDAEVLSFVDSLIPMHLYNVCFCGGEPLIRKELIFKCIKKLKEAGTHCSLVSNGILATYNTIDMLEICGLDAIQFSLDGCKNSHDKLRGKNGVYDAVIKAVDYVVNETNLHLSVAFTPTNFNIDDFIWVYDYLSSLWKKSKRYNSGDYIDFRLQPLMLLGRAKSNSMIMPSSWQYRKLVSLIHEREELRFSDGIELTWGDPIDHLLRYSDSNYFLDQAIVHANGDIVVSAYIPLVVGNIRKHSLNEYWENGLNKIWSRKVVKELVSRVQSIPDMEILTNSIADINMDSGIYLDLMESDLDNLNLIKGVIDN